MIKTLCVVVLSLALAGCTCETDASGEGCGTGGCDTCTGCDSKEGQDGAQDADGAVKDATEEAVDKKDAMTPAPADLPKKSDEGK